MRVRSKLRSFSYPVKESVRLTGFATLHHRRYSYVMRPLRYSINITLDGCCDHRVMIADEGCIATRSRTSPSFHFVREKSIPSLKLSGGLPRLNGAEQMLRISKREDALEAPVLL